MQKHKKYNQGSHISASTLNSLCHTECAPVAPRSAGLGALPNTSDCGHLSLPPPLSGPRSRAHVGKSLPPVPNLATEFELLHDVLIQLRSERIGLLVFSLIACHKEMSSLSFFSSSSLARRPSTSLSFSFHKRFTASGNSPYLLILLERRSSRSLTLDSWQVNSRSS